MREHSTYRPLSHSVFVGTVCSSSYWIGTSRQELAEKVAERRHQQAIPSSQFISFDPSIGATAALADHRRRMPKLAKQVQPRVVPMDLKVVWG
jgi:hypothetical protein